MNLEFFGENPDTAKGRIGKKVQALAIEMDQLLTDTKYKEHAMMKLLEAKRALEDASVACYIFDDDGESDNEE